MEKQRQKQLQKWLKLQSRTIKKFIHLNVLFGSLSALLMIGQMWLLATILQKVMLENIASNTLMTELGCLISCFADLGARTSGFSCRKNFTACITSPDY